VAASEKGCQRAASTGRGREGESGRTSFVCEQGTTSPTPGSARAGTCGERGRDMDVPADRSCIVLTDICFSPHFSQTSSTCSARRETVSSRRRRGKHRAAGPSTHVDLLLLDLTAALDKARLELPQGGREGGRVRLGRDDLALVRCECGHRQLGPAE